MQLPIYQVDAFTDKLFSGNPAAVVITRDQLSAELMQSIASENNLAETAFVFGDDDDLSIRWFTPTVEVDLCGHATLAAAHILFDRSHPSQSYLTFDSKSGHLRVDKDDDYLWLDFPVDTLQEVPHLSERISNAIKVDTVAVFRGRSDIMAVVDGEDRVQAMCPDQNLLRTLNCRGIIVTARGNDVDFVSRFFAPRSGIPEDPVTGSAHTMLTPYWAKLLGKRELQARQLSDRRGSLRCRDAGDRIHIGGKAVMYLQGMIEV